VEQTSTSPEHGRSGQISPVPRHVARSRCVQRIVTVLALALAATTTAFAASKDGPSRAADKGCTWEKLSDAKLGLEAWVQRCNYGDRKIDFVVKGTSLVQRFSDGGEPEPVIDVFDLAPGEQPDAGVKRIFAAHTDAALAKRCVLAPYREGKAPAVGERFTFVPDRAYAKELKAKQDPNEIGDPPCGDFGDSPDGIQYFETQPKSGVAKVLFVRVGQDVPLFDERTLRLLPPAPGPAPSKAP
jgi:hypothetical protein